MKDSVMTFYEQACLDRNKLGNALKRIIKIKNKMSGGDWDEIEEARTIAKEALDEILEGK